MKLRLRDLSALREGRGILGEPLQKLRRQVETHFGFQILLARTEIGGYCSHCQALRAQEVSKFPREPRVVPSAAIPSEAKVTGIGANALFRGNRRSKRSGSTSSRCFNRFTAFRAAQSLHSGTAAFSDRPPRR